MSSPFAGRGAKAHEAERRLPRWSTNAVRRLAQIKQPGEYDLRLIVEPDGTRKLHIAGRVETLGK